LVANLGCPMGLKRLLDRLQLCPCAPDQLGSQVLRVILLSASNLRMKASDFYIEAWTDPIEGHPKLSRIHSAMSADQDLGQEELELDWYGDEREVVIHIVERGVKQSSDLPAFELRIPRASVERYARESEGVRDEAPRTRSFRLTPMVQQDALKRKHRFQNTLLPSGLTLRLFRMLGEGHGLQVASADEYEKLRRENQALRQENSSLCSQAGKVVAADSTWNEERCRAVASVVLSFELVPRRHQLPEFPIRQASFQTVDVN